MKPKLKTILSKIFALAGAILLWAPIAFLFVTAVIASIAEKLLLFDYLMLAELFWLVVSGLILLLVAWFGTAIVAVIELFRWVALGFGGAFLSSMSM